MNPKPTQTDRYLAELADPRVSAERKALLKADLFRPLIGNVTNPDRSQVRTPVESPPRGESPDRKALP